MTKQPLGEILSERTNPSENLKNTILFNVENMSFGTFSPSSKLGMPKRSAGTKCSPLEYQLVTGTERRASEKHSTEQKCWQLSVCFLLAHPTRTDVTGFFFLLFCTPLQNDKVTHHTLGWIVPEGSTHDPPDIDRRTLQILVRCLSYCFATRNLPLLIRATCDAIDRCPMTRGAYCITLCRCIVRYNPAIG